MRFGVDLNGIEIFGPPIAAVALSLYLGQSPIDSVVNGLAAMGSYAVTKAITVGGQKFHALETIGVPVAATVASAYLGNGTKALVHGLGALGSYAITKTVATAGQEAPKNRPALK